MDYYILMDLVTDLGYELAMCGAETFRIEDSIRRIMASYDLEAEVFAIPNYLVVSMITDIGKPVTRMRRIGYHGNDLDGVERLNALSRRICAQTPTPQEAMSWLDEYRATRRKYSLAVTLLGGIMGAAGFAVMFGANTLDCIWAGLCGLVIGLVNTLMDKLKANTFISTLLAAFCMAMLAYGLNLSGLVRDPDTVNIGALMLLVPGLLFTNAMRDIIYGDTNSGINRIVQVLMIAISIALGTAAAWNLVRFLWGEPSTVSPLVNPVPLQCLVVFVSCLGFGLIFNIHGPGGLLCALGGVFCWIAYLLTLHFGGSEVLACFFAAVISDAYAESMARVRKCPAISYLVVAIFPLIPGAGVYYTMNYAVRGQMDLFAQKGMHTAAIAGVMAVGILLTSTIVRLVNAICHSRVIRHF